MQRVFNSDQTMSSIPIGEPNWLADYECTWRLTKSKERRPGCFVKVNHWPSLEMQRTANWGWQVGISNVNFMLPQGTLIADCRAQTLAQSVLMEIMLIADAEHMGGIP